MANVESETAAAVAMVFQDMHGDIPFNLIFVAGFASSNENSISGECDFRQTPPLISVRSGMGESELVEILCHEFAHLRCGISAGHDDAWEASRDELSVRFWAQCIR